MKVMRVGLLCLAVAAFSLPATAQQSDTTGAPAATGFKAKFKEKRAKFVSRMKTIYFAAEVMQLADRKLNDLTPVGRVELTENIAMKADHYLNSYGPNAYLPATYGDKSMGLGPTPLLDRWIEPVSTSLECH
jgi:hypothetical protein